MKKQILYIIIFIVILASLLWIWYRPNLKLLFPSKPNIEEWQYKGHDMLLYEYKNSYSICHSPTCIKCYQVYD